MLTYERLTPEQKLAYSVLTSVFRMPSDKALSFIETTSAPFTTIWQEARKLGITDAVFKYLLERGVSKEKLEEWARSGGQVSPTSSTFEQYLPWIVIGASALVGIFILKKLLER